MSDESEVILWRAPPPICRDPSREVREGYDASEYPGNGPYFATQKPVADGFRMCYRNGMQEIHMESGVFEKLVEAGIIQGDEYYPPGQSWHVSATGLSKFNEVVKQGLLNLYFPEETPQS